MPFYFFYFLFVVVPGSALCQFVDPAFFPLNEITISLHVVPSKTASLSWGGEPCTRGGYFVIERKSAFSSFQPMVTVKVLSEGQHYFTMDEKPSPGVNFYRIKLVSETGKISYSRIVSADLGTTSFCKFYPNPADDHVIVQAAKPVEIRIFSALGVLLLSKLLDKGLGAVDLSSLPRGTYILKLINSETGATMKEVLYKK